MFSFHSNASYLWAGVLASLCAVACGRPHETYSREDYTYVEKYENYYKFHDEKLSWGESKAKCESEGATLYYPESETEARDVTTLLHVWTTGLSIYVGISDLEELGAYKTVDGRPISQVYHGWDDGEPNSGTRNQFRCVNLWNDFTFVVFSCDDPNYYRSFICKKPNTPVQELNPPLNNDKSYEGSQGALSHEDYTYVEKYNNYYKFHSEKLSWSESKAKCESEGATLYYPESEAEVRDVIALLHVWSANVDWINIGISDLEQLGVYKTIDGRPVSEVYNKWKPNEPDTGTNNEYRCVNLWDDFRMQVHFCDSFSRAFICNKPKIVEHNSEVTQITPGQELNTLPNNDKYEGSQGALSHEDYTYVEKYNNYYKFHSEKLGWSESKAKCESEGATLYYPESEAEVRDVTALLHVWSANVDWINIGISDLEQLGVYKTIDGRPVSEVYNKWKPNEPDTGTNNEYRCVNLWDDFRLQVHFCDSRLFSRAFICKKPKIVEHKSETTTGVAQITPGQKLNTLPNNDKCEGVCGEGEGDADSSSVFFGRTVGEELRRLPARARLRAMVGITRVLKEETPETNCHTPALTNE